MAVVKRNKDFWKDHKVPIRVIKACAGVLGLILFAALLFEMDAFTKLVTAKHHRKKSAPHLSPDVLLLQHQQPKIPNVRSGNEQDVTTNSESESRDVPAADETAASNRKRVALLLRNLKGGAQGEIVIETVAEWAPIGVEHFWELVRANFYQECRFFRVLPNFVAQFGIGADPVVHSQWKSQVLKDDPVLQTNARGTLTYAMSGKNSRTTQLFINLNSKGNAYLDAQGFAPIGRVVQGMEFLDEIADQDREKPKQGQIVLQGNRYLEQDFPNLTYIASIRVISEEDTTGEESTVAKSV